MTRFLAAGLLSLGCFLPACAKCSYESHVHPEASEPCAPRKQLEAIVRESRVHARFDEVQAAAFDLLVSADSDKTSYFFTFDGEGGLGEPTADIQALWALLESDRPDAAFSALFLESEPGSTGQFAALIGLRDHSPGLFGVAALHFAHSGEHFALYPYPGAMCGVGWLDWQPGSLGGYIDGLDLRSYKERWETQVAHGGGPEER